MRLLALVSLALMVAACSGDDSAQPPTEPARPPTEPARPLSEPAPPPAASTVTPTATTVVTPTATAAPRPPDPLLVGAIDDAVRQPGPHLGQLAAAGFRAVGITSYWDPGQLAPTAGELAVLQDTASRAQSAGVRVFLAVFHRGSATTPISDEARGQFAAYVSAIVQEVPAIGDVIVGNEPNLNRFWLPQFGPGGENVAASAYFKLLAETYDAAKRARPSVRVWGGALAPRGIDRPNTGRDTHSPTTFIRDLGAAYRASGRSAPPLDGFALHPYPESPATPPDLPHPNSKTIGIADHAKLVDLLQEAFDTEPAILYSELGVETVIPAAKRPLYKGAEPVEPVDEATQADYYRRAIELASCQPVVGLLLFHSHDEPFLTGFQSGVYYVDGTPKASLEPVRAAIEAARTPRC